VVECWSDLARALAIYPPTNSRVVRALEAFFAALRPRVSGGSRMVEICFSSGAVWVDDAAFDLKAGSNPAWLKDRLDRADLSGAVFSDVANEASLLAFTQRLLDLFSRQNLDLPFKELWPESHSGITLLERRFEGGFLEPGSGPEGLARHGVVGHAKLRVKHISNALSLEPRVRGAVDRLQARLLARAPENASYGNLDIIGEIVDVLPAEGLYDMTTAVGITEKILSALEGELGRGQMTVTSSPEDDQGRFRRLLFTISRSHFNTIETGPRVLRMASRGDGAVAAEKPPESFQERDAEIGEDLDALVSELENLGTLRTDAAGNEDVSDPAEELGVFLHYLVSDGDPSRFPTLGQGIGRLLQAAGETGTTLLRRYLEASRSGDTRVRDLRVGRVATWLRKNGHREYLAKCGLLGAEWISREFPDEFLAYLETLDLDDVRDVRKLDAVCREIGPKRFQDAADLLAGASDFAASPVAAQLFRLSLPSIGPLLWRIYEKDPPRHEAAFTRYVRTTAASRLDQAILELALGTPSGLPPYWKGLFANDAEKLAEQRAQAVHSILGQTEGDPARVDQHVRAINLLANFDTPRTREYLHRLVDERGPLLLKKHPRTVRAAAEGVLRVLKEDEG